MMKAAPKADAAPAAEAKKEEAPKADAAPAAEAPKRRSS
jgi:small subunit ribosomal protein S16